MVVAVSVLVLVVVVVVVHAGLILKQLQADVMALESLYEERQVGFGTPP